MTAYAKANQIQKWRTFISKIKALNNLKNCEVTNNSEINLEKFKALIINLYELKNKKQKAEISTENKNLSLLKLLTSFQEKKSIALTNRQVETKKNIENIKEPITFSTFEIMEHNFRENTHSNILKHLFNCRITDWGSKILSAFILKTTNNNVLSDLLLKKTYTIFREYPTKNGRIDLLIEDRKNKFVIVIENKLLANISIKEYSEEEKVTKTQLDNYTDYVTKNYKGFSQTFILLSMYPNYEIDINNFIQSDYVILYDILKEVNSENSIIKEYRCLLKSLINYEFDKEWIIEYSNKILENKQINLLNTFELVNKYIA